MSTPIFTTSIGLSLQETLEDVIDDDTDGVEAKAEYNSYYEVEEMDKAFIDYLETGGPGLASEMDEGEEIPTATMYEGFVTRFIARKVGIRMIASEEAVADGQYTEVINAAKRNKRAIWKTVDVDAANTYNRMFNTSYTGGDDQPLGSSSHTLPGGGTFSNQFTTAFSPSRAAVIVARGETAKWPGHDGTREGYMLTAIDYPIIQQSVWEGITDSAKVPESNNNEVNVVKGMGLKHHPIRHWTASDTNYAFRTDAADGGLFWYWRDRPESRQWLENANQMLHYSQHYRAARGWKDARGHLCVNA
jgi:hypothetical protein